MAKSTLIKLLIVRACSSEWDLADRLSGSADLPLSAEGMEQVEAIVAGLNRGMICQVWTGPEETATQTARAIAEVTGAKLKSIPDLHEVGVGLWEGLNCTDAEERAGKPFRQWREDPTSILPPGGEPIAEAADRIIGHVQSLLTKSRGDESCGVSFVLRPMAFGIVRCWLKGEDLSRMWPKPTDTPEWLLIDRESLRSNTKQTPSTIRCAS